MTAASIPDQRRYTVGATVLVIVHFVIAFLHGHPHSTLEVPLMLWQNVYIYTLIVAAPLVAAALLWTRWFSAGVGLLAFSMLASFCFGVFFHFIYVSPDHIHHLPPGDLHGLFIATAYLLAVIEAGGTIYGAWGWMRFRQPAVAPATA